MVSGGSALIEVEGAIDPHDPPFHVFAGSRDITSVFRVTAIPNREIGLITDLPVGKSEIVVERGERKQASLSLTNYAIT
jgi:hypothetical protein